MKFGIDISSGLIYEGLSTAELPCIPRPSVTQAKVVESDADWINLPEGLSQSPFAWVFREDSFDAVTRTRRGRLYQATSSQPTDQQVVPHPQEDPALRTMGRSGRVEKSLYTYFPCTSLLSMPYQGKGATLVLGTRQASSAWRIIQSELLVSADVMVTLKALTAFGVVPEIDAAAVDKTHMSSVSQAMNRVVESAFRETPISVIDHCRNAATVVLSRWLVQQGADQSILAKDLGAVAKAAGDAPHDKHCARNMADTIAKLHVRGKANEQHSKQLRLPVEEDAELALQALGFMLREIGWAKA